MEGTAAYAENQTRSIDDVVREYLPLVKKIGLHLVARLPSDVELDDLMQVGMIGLIQARESYDASLGASFSTFAGIRIKGAMLDEVRRNDWVPRSVQQKIKRVSQAIREAEARLGRSVTDSEIANELGVSLSEYHDISRELVHSRLTSLDQVEVESESDEPSLSVGHEDVKFKEGLVRAINALPEREMLMMSLYYGDELNLKEIGEVMGVSESRVSQIHGQALARVRTRMNEWLE
ncbi:MAG: RNA polymerase sigma factor for flagellar operon FliA [Halioglobus sp.]|jgi:RNA polymerase sigma factor for flagellar operon FliA